MEPELAQRVNDLLTIDRQADAYGERWKANAHHDLRLYWAARAAMDELTEEGLELPTISEVLGRIMGSVNLDDDQHWADASWEHEVQKTRDAIEEHFDEEEEDQ